MKYAVDIPALPPAPAVQVQGVAKAFAGRPALTDVDLTVAEGTVLALLGPNGAGKTTLVRILATLLRPDRGSVTVAGHDVVADPVGVRRSLSLTGQYAAVDDLLTGAENLELMARLRHLGRRAARRRTAELLATFGLGDAGDRRVGTYSGGMRRRLDLAASIIEQPRVLVLDEPTTGLDPRSREQLWDTVRGLVGAGVTVVLTTQYLDEADQLADNVAVLDGGRVVAQGSAAALKASVGTEILELAFADDATWARAAGCLEGADLDEHRRLLGVRTDGTAAAVEATLRRLAVAGAPPARLAVHRPSLDDVFLAFTGGTTSPDDRDAMVAGAEVA